MCGGKHGARIGKTFLTGFVCVREREKHGRTTHSFSFSLTITSIEKSQKLVHCVFIVFFLNSDNKRTLSCFFPLLWLQGLPFRPGLHFASRRLVSDKPEADKSMDRLQFISQPCQSGIEDEAILCAFILMHITSGERGTPPLWTRRW